MKQSCSHSITSNLIIYKRIGKNTFSIGKNWTLNTLAILCIPENYSIKKDSEYLNRIFGVLPKHIKCEMKTIQDKFTLKKFHDEQGTKFM